MPECYLFIFSPVKGAVTSDFKPAHFEKLAVTYNRIEIYSSEYLTYFLKEAANFFASALNYISKVPKFYLKVHSIKLYVTKFSGRNYKLVLHKYSCDC